ncbi:MAG: DUF4270 family protein [Ginsengibacter sp.]
MLLIFAWGCTKIDSTQLGQGLIPTVDNVHTFDTSLYVIAKNFDNPSDCDSVNRNDLHALGIISNDPLFGKTAANIYLELKPAVYPFTLPDHDIDSLVLDSAVLVLSYTGSYGDTNTIQKVKAFELSNKFNSDSPYYTCNVLNYDFTPLGEQTFSPKHLRDSVHAFRENSINQLRIPISNALVQDWLNTASITFQSDSLFVNKFKGFAIVPDQSFGGQALNYFSLSNANTRLSIYIRSSKGTVKDTSILNLSFTNYSNEANSIARTRGSSEITNHLTHPVNGDSLLYIQTSPGSYAEVTIPGLSGLSNRIINRAELIVDQQYSPNTFDEYFTPPQMLYLDTKDTITSGRYIPVPCDFSGNELTSGFKYLGGHAVDVNDGSGNTVKRYTFNLSRYVQNIVTRNSYNTVFRLRAPYYIVNTTFYSDKCGQAIPPFNQVLNNIAVGRVRLNGSNNTSTRIRLRIIYSVL